MEVFDICGVGCRVLYNSVRMKTIPIIFQCYLIIKNESLAQF